MVYPCLVRDCSYCKMCYAQLNKLLHWVTGYLHCNHFPNITFCSDMIMTNSISYFSWQFCWYICSKCLLKIIIVLFYFMVAQQLLKFVVSVWYFSLCEFCVILICFSFTYVLHDTFKWYIDMITKYWDILPIYLETYDCSGIDSISIHGSLYLSML